ncbi:MAG: hypothetical protein ACI4EN_03820 [Butyrivibrio sp.]
MIVFWFLARTLKYHFISEITYPDVVRYLWYLYYLPMLFIPMLSVFVALSLRKPEGYRMPGYAFLLCIPATVLFLFVITNDLHQLVFNFPRDALVWDGSEYGYAVMYWPILGFIFVCALATFIIMYNKCRLPEVRRTIILPCVPVLLLFVYSILYYLQIKWVRFIFGDVTALTCLFYIVAFELCIRLGFIQSNSHYRELLNASAVGMIITDKEYNVFRNSKTAIPVDTDTLRRTDRGPVILEDGIRISGAPISGGYVVWQEDISALIQVLDELKEAKENLEDGNAILEEENAFKAREAHIAEQERLYNIIQRDTARQIIMMDELINQVELAEDEEARIKLLKKMLVIGAYLKRRSNLVFMADKTPMLEAKELDLTFGESMDNLEMYGVTCGFYSELAGPCLGVHMMAMYDFYEEIVERSLDCMSCITVHADMLGDELRITVNTDSTADLSKLVSDMSTAVQDEDGEWKLTLMQYAGGDV